MIRDWLNKKENMNEQPPPPLHQPGQDLQEAPQHLLFQKKRNSIRLTQANNKLLLVPRANTSNSKKRQWCALRLKNYHCIQQIWGGGVPPLSLGGLSKPGNHLHWDVHIPKQLIPRFFYKPLRVCVCVGGIPHFHPRGLLKAWVKKQGVSFTPSLHWNLPPHTSTNPNGTFQAMICTAGVLAGQGQGVESEFGPISGQHPSILFIPTLDLFQSGFGPGCEMETAFVENVRRDLDRRSASFLIFHQCSFPQQHYCQSYPRKTSSRCSIGWIQFMLVLLLPLRQIPGGGAGRQLLLPTALRGLFSPPCF